METIVHGVTATNQVVPLLVDASGSPIVLGNAYGWYNSAWRKSPPAFGPSNYLLHFVDNTNLAAGTNNLDFATVPANQVWVYTNIYMQYNGTPPTNISAQIATWLLYRQNAPATTVGYDRQGYWPVFPGYWLRMVVAGATAGDDAFFRGTGFIMDLTAT